MATILYVGTWGSDDSTRATMPFLSANGAVEAGHKAEIMLLGEATYLLKDHIVDQIDGVGWPPLQGILSQVIENGTPIHV